MKLDYVVVGGGISGLSAAFECQKLGQKGVVLEANTRIGGCIETISVADFYHELGGHSCFNSYANLLRILDKLPKKLNLLPVKKPPFLVFKNHQLSSVLSNINLPILLFSLFKVFFIQKTRRTAQDYYQKILGKKNYQTMIKHALSAVSCQNIDKMPADFLFQKRIKNKKIPRKFSFEQGLSQMISAIADTLNVQTDSKVTMIEKLKNGWKIKTDTQIFTADKLILATNAKISGRLLQPVDGHLATSLATFKSTKLDTMAVLVDNPLTDIKLCAGWIGVETDFYSMVSKDTVSHSSDKRAFTFHFKPDVLSTDQQKDFIKKSLKINENQVIKWFSKQNILPLIESNHYQKTTQLQKLIPDNLAIIGNYFKGMAIEDCIERSLFEVGRIFK